jgi:hypothetical protein
MDGYDADNAPVMDEVSPFANDFDWMPDVRDRGLGIGDRVEKPTVKKNVDVVKGAGSGDKGLGTGELPAISEEATADDAPIDADTQSTIRNPQPAIRNSPLASRHHRTLKIIFSRSGQLDRDKWRLREIVDAVRDPKGRDQFVIVMESDRRRHQLTFPNDYCNVSDRLLSELQKYFNVDVAVEE